MERIINIWRENQSLFICVFLIGIFAFGYECANLTFSLNEEDAWMLRPDYTKLAHAPNSRWAMFIYDLILPGLRYPFISCVAGIAFLTVGYVGYLSIWPQIGFPGKLFAGALAISSPTWAHMQEFSFMSAYVACSMMLTIFAVVLATRSRNLLYNRLIPIIMLTFSLLTYQSLIFLFFAPLIINCLITGFKKQYIYSYMRVFFIAIISLCLYYIINLLLFHLTPIVKSEYLNVYIGWGNLKFMEIVKSVYYNIKYIFSGVFVTYEYYYLLAVPIGIIIFNDIKERQISHLISIILLFGLFVSIFIIFGNRMNNRTLLYFPFLFGGVFLAAYHVARRKFYKYIVCALAFFIVISNASMDTKLFMLDSMARERDNLITNRVFNEIYDACPDYMSKADGVIFMGGVKEEPTLPSLKLYDLEGFGYSFWSQRFADPWMLYGYLRSHGIPLPGLANVSELHNYIKEFNNMPCYPARGCASLLGKTLVVKLSNIEIKSDQNE